MRLQGEEQLYWDCRGSKSYPVTRRREIFILGLKGEEQLYWYWFERNIYTETGCRGNVKMGLEVDE